MSVLLKFDDSPRNQKVNAETLSADKTLTDQDKQIQLLDPNGVTRTVKLSTPSDNSPFFIIENTNSSSTVANIYVVDHNGKLGICLAPGEYEEFKNSGESGFWSSERNGRFLGQSILHYGNLTGATGRTLTANGSPQDAAIVGGAAEDLPSTAFVMPFAGTIETAGSSWQTDNVNMIEFYRNGLATKGFSLGFHDNGYISYPAKISFSSGDRIAIRHTSNNSQSGNQTIVRPTGDTHYGAAVGFGANLTTTTNYARSNGTSTSTQSASTGPLTNHPMMIDGSGINVSWHVTASGGTIRIHNLTAVTSTDVVLSATEGSSTISLSFSASDAIAIQYLSGTAPGNSNFLFWTNIAGLIYSFGGNNTAANQFWGICGEANELLDTVSDEENEVIISMPGALEAVSWNITNTGGDLRIYKNGSSAGVTTTTMSTALGRTVFGNVSAATVNVGDIIAIIQDTATTAGNSVVNLLIGPTSA